MFRICYPRHHRHHHHRMGLGRFMLMGLFFGPWLFRRMMRWGRYGGGWGGPGPRGGWGGPGPRGGWRSDFDRGPRHGPHGPHGVDYV
jgi:hypothetical protein